MDPVSFFTSARVHIVAGKGGVGKSTLTAGLGLAAATLGLDVLLIEIEGRGGLAGYFGRSGFGYEAVSLGPGLRGRTVRAEDALLDYLAADRLSRLARRMLDSGLVEMVSRAAPGLGDLLVLGKIKQLERLAVADVIVVDAPASGHALTLLRAPGGLLETVQDGPIHAQAAEVVELLTDPRRCQVLLVTRPQETPLNELVESAFDLEDRIGVQLGPILVNGVQAPPIGLEETAEPGAVELALSNMAPADAALLEAVTPFLRRAVAFEWGRYQRQQRQLQRLGQLLPLSQMRIGQRSGDGLTSGDLPGLAEELLAAIHTLEGTQAPEFLRRGAVRVGSGGAAPRPGPAEAGPTRQLGESATGTIAGLTRTAQVIVCAGAGGVGKTSVAAALALQGAHQGRRVVVLTIDPARRLADALGLGALAERTQQVSGPWSGELHVTMLDVKDTFDRLIRRYAADGAQQEEILANRFYRNISNALSGTGEYMAAERLFELHQSGRYDLIVIDTPPTRAALDFLDAPARLTRFLDHRLYRVLAGSGTARRGSTVAAQLGLGAVRTAGRVVGSAVLNDAIDFFRAFGGMQEGFRERALGLRALLVGPGTSFVVVAAPQPDSLAEAHSFLQQLGRQHLVVSALVLNRVAPSFGRAGEVSPGATGTASLAQRLAVTSHPWASAVADLAALIAIREGQLARGRSTAGNDDALPLVVVAELDDDVHDLTGVERLRLALIEGDGP